MESTNDLPAAERTRDVSVRLWSARGFFWGLASIGLAFMGQQALITEGNTGAAWACYILAILLLLASLSHPSPALLRRIRGQGAAIGDAEAISVPAPTAAVKPTTLRARLGWLVTAPLLALSLVLTVASAYLLWRDILALLAAGCGLLRLLPSSYPS